MAVTFTGLTSGIAASTNIPVTASVAPGANRVQLLSFTYHTILTVGDPATVTGGGVTWNKIIGGQAFSTGVGNFLYSAMSASPGTGPITIDASNISGIDDWTWQVVEFGGVDPSGTNGSGALISFNQATATASSLSTTLPAGADAVYGVCYAHSNGATLSPGSGFTKYGDADDSSTCQTAVEYQLAAATAVDFSYSVSVTLGIYALGIKADPGTGSATGGASGSGIYRLKRRPWSY